MINITSSNVYIGDLSAMHSAVQDVPPMGDLITDGLCLESFLRRSLEAGKTTAIAVSKDDDGGIIISFTSGVSDGERMDYVVEGDSVYFLERQ